MMAPWRELLLWLLVLVALALIAGAAVMILHGLLLRCRLRCARSFTECVPLRSIVLAVTAGLTTLLLLTQAKTVPLEWLDTLVLLVFTASVLLAWLGPPEEHVEVCGLCQIGKGFAYGHFNGYLRHMRGVHGARKRLQDFRHSNTAGLPRDVLTQFFSDAVLTLAPADGEYPDNALSEMADGDLPGVSNSIGCLPYFQFMVGGNRRSYGGFSVHKVTSSDGSRSRYVALDRVDTLATMRNLRQHGPAGLKHDYCKKQMRELLDELEKIVNNRVHLRGQVRLVRYHPEEDHVGDAILASIADSMSDRLIRC